METRHRKNFAQISPNSYVSFMKSLSQFYTNPIESTAREIISNALDSHERAQQTTPVTVYLRAYLPANRPIMDLETPPTNFYSDTDMFFVVSDNGTGMSYEELNTNLLNYGDSSKINNFAEKGKHGIGAKSPLSVTNTYFIETVKNGLYNRIKLTLDETEGLYSTFEITDFPVPNIPSGTNVMIPAEFMDISPSAVSKIFGGLEKTKLEVYYKKNRSNSHSDGFFPLESKNPEIVYESGDTDASCIGYIINQHPVSKTSDFSDHTLNIIADGIIYPVQSPETNLLPETQNLLIGFKHNQVFMNIGMNSLDIPNHRDTLTYTPRMKALIHEQLELVIDGFLTYKMLTIQSQPLIDVLHREYKNWHIYSYFAFNKRLQWNGLDIFDVTLSNANSLTGQAFSLSVGKVPLIAPAKRSFNVSLNVDTGYENLDNKALVILAKNSEEKETQSARIPKRKLLASIHKNAYIVDESALTGTDKIIVELYKAIHPTRVVSLESFMDAFIDILSNQTTVSQDNAKKSVVKNIAKFVFTTTEKTSVSSGESKKYVELNYEYVSKSELPFNETIYYVRSNEIPKGFRGVLNIHLASLSSFNRVDMAQVMQDKVKENGMAHNMFRSLHFPYEEENLRNTFTNLLYEYVAQSTSVTLFIIPSRMKLHLFQTQYPQAQEFFNTALQPLFLEKYAKKALEKQQMLATHALFRSLLFRIPTFLFEQSFIDLVENKKFLETCQHINDTKIHSPDSFNEGFDYMTALFGLGLTERDLLNHLNIDTVDSNNADNLMLTDEDKELVSYIEVNKAKLRFFIQTVSYSGYRVNDPNVSSEEHLHRLTGISKMYDYFASEKENTDSA